MITMNRRELLASGMAVGMTGVSPSFAHEPTGPIGAWSSIADMPFAVQEIYPAPFWRAGSDVKTLKPSPHNIIVNAGGIAPGTPHNVSDETVYYDPSRDQWRYGPPLPQARHHLALVNNNGFLYGIGGFARDDYGGWQMRSNCWRLTTIDDAGWEQMASLPIERGEVVCQSLGGFIHVVGGRSPASSRNSDWSDHIDTDEHSVFDAAANRWFPAAPLPRARNSSAGAVLGGALYVIGGRTVSEGNTDRVDVYDPLSDRWNRSRPLPQAIGGAAAAVLNGKIYVFGGEYFSPASGGVFSQTWEYDPKTDRWRSVAAMARPRHGLGAVTLGSTIYALGGAAQVGGNAPSSALDQFTIAAQ